MRPLVSFSTVFSLFFAITLIVAETTEFIDNQDTRISYSNGWQSINYDGRTLAFNNEASATASLSVSNTTRIAVSVSVGVSGQVVRITLDKKNYDVLPSASQQPAWTSGSLDPNVRHDLQVIKRTPAGQAITLDYILVTHPDPPTVPGVQATAVAAQTPTAPNQYVPSASPSAASPPAASLSAPPAALPGTNTNTISGVSASGPLPSNPNAQLYTSNTPGESNASTNADGPGASSGTTQSIGQSDPSTHESFTSLFIPGASSTPSAQQPNTDSVLSGGKLAAVILVCIAVPTLITTGVILYRRKKLGQRKAASTMYLEWMAARGHPPPGASFSPTSPDEMFGHAEGSMQQVSTGDSTNPRAVAFAL